MEMVVSMADEIMSRKEIAARLRAVANHTKPWKLSADPNVAWRVACRQAADHFDALDSVSLAAPEGGDIILECAKIALTVLRPNSPDWATYHRLVDGKPLGVGDLAYAWATGCNHMSTHIHDAIMEFKESSTPQNGQS